MLETWAVFPQTSVLHRCYKQGGEDTGKQDLAAIGKQCLRKDLFASHRFFRQGVKHIGTFHCIYLNSELMIQKIMFLSSIAIYFQDVTLMRILFFFFNSQTSFSHDNVLYLYQAERNDVNLGSARHFIVTAEGLHGMKIR